MRKDGVIGKYAIGVAVGATFYLKPSAIVDVDAARLLPYDGDLPSVPLVDEESHR